jgi:filamentous hemagglutinin
LGAGQDLTVTTPALSNSQGLFFSGADMQVNTATLINQKGDFYSLRNLTIGGYGSARANQMSNISGSMESVSKFTLSATAFENRTEGSDGTQNFAVGRTLVKGFIAVQCIDCSGDHYEVNYIARETFDAGQDSDTSASALLSAGSDFTFTGSSFLNSKSTVSAGGNISIQADNFKNIGAVSGTVERTRTYSQGVVTDGTVDRFMPEVVAYNQRDNPDFPMIYYVTSSGELRLGVVTFATGREPGHDGGLIKVTTVKDVETSEDVSALTVSSYAWGNTPASRYDPANLLQLPAALSGMALISDMEVAKDGTGNAGRSAVIQAGGNVSITATQDLQNSVIHEDYASAGGTNKVADTHANGTGTTVVVRLNAQLPPDLAQQQVDPTSLPGFSLPTGQNGLFRLSGQGSSSASATQANAGSQNWTITGASVSAEQRDQAIPDAHISDIRISSVGPASGTTRQITTTKRERAGVNAGISALDTTIPNGAGGAVVSLPGHQASQTSITNVGEVTGVDASHLPAAILPTGQATVTRSIAKVRGLPATTRAPGAPKYLIETNPVLTDLKQFMSSDYLLARLGYDPDTSAKRLGDGLYEQRLVQQAVTARTGQAFIDGQTSNENQFKYLMTNAIASKEELNLSVGVSLTSEQVAALTHDIVWLEEHEVNGEKVLVPVLYLAQADNRLAPNGALIAGNDVTLIAGRNLDNVGTLKATNNLSATAGNDLVNSGLVEAGNRLDLLAGNDITNKAGGIIEGRDVWVTSIAGDILNERTVTSAQASNGYVTTRQDFANSAARIEAANDLTVSAGRDLTSSGVLQSGRDLTLSAGRDVSLLSAKTQTSFQAGDGFFNQTITQIGSTTLAGRDLSVTAGRDVTGIASQIDAKRDIAIAAKGELTLTSAADEDHTYGKTKKVTTREDQINQVSTTLTAGGDIALKAGNDLAVIASAVKAGKDVSLDAGRDVYVTSAQNEDYSYYKKKKKGSFGRSSTRETESYDSTNVASVITAGHDLSINASQDASDAISINGGRDVIVTGSQLKAGNDMLVGATGDVSIASAAEEGGGYSKKTKSGLFGNSKNGKSRLQTTETPIGSNLQAGNDTVIVAGRDVNMSASTLTTGRDAELHAGLLDDTGNISLASASDLAHSHSESYKSKLGLSLSGSSDGFGFGVGASSQKGHEVTTSSGVGSQVVAGRDAILDSARDINILGSSVDAQQTATLSSGRDINIVAGAENSQSADWKSKKDSGLSITWDRNGFTGFIGETTVRDKYVQGSQTVAASHLAGGNVNLDAGRDISIQGSDVYADNNAALNAGRDIRIDAAADTDTEASSHSVTSNGISATVNHNYGSTVDALKNIGKGDDAVSKVPSVLKAADTLDQFLRGATMDGSAGNTGRDESLTNTIVSNRSSTLNAGGDISMVAVNNVTVRGSSLQAGRDINVKGRDVTFDVAKGASIWAGEQNQSKGGIVGGTSGGFKVGIGGSSGVANQDSNQGMSGDSQLSAGRNVNLEASNDLSLIGTRVQANRDINLKAGNDLTLRAAQNNSMSSDSRHSGGGEVGLTAGQNGIGVYASVNLGRGDLDREAEKQQEAYLYAGNKLGFESGRDTTIAGATVRGDEVIGKVGRDLTVSSVPDTGKVTGKEFDVSATVTVGYGGSVSGSIGYGQTTGSTNWVGNQTSITAKDKLDVRTRQHTQLDGAVLASDSGNLKLDTGTLGFSDIAGIDKEHGYYLNVGGTYGWGTSGTANQDSSQAGKGKEGESGWSVSGYNDQKDREQIVRATVGAGNIVVRSDAATGDNSTAGLNRDLSKAYEITKDEQHRTDLYVSSSSLDMLSHPVDTAKEWKQAALNYDKFTKGRFSEVTTSAARIWSEIQAQTVTIDQIPDASRKALGDQRALDIRKNLVRAGLDPSVLGTLPSAVTTQLNGWADCAAGTCPVTAGSGESDVSAPDQLSGSTLVLDPTVTASVTPFMALFLTRTSDLIQQINELPVQETQVAMLAMQAAMGPAKATLNLAIHALAHAAFGEQYDKLKEELAVALTAKLTETERDEIQQAHNDAKAAYAAADHSLYQLDGDSQVLASEFLIDLVGGGVQSLGRKVAGRTISIVGAKGGSAVADDFFAGTKYTDKVLGQIKTGDLHGFPESVKTFQGAGQVTKITGGDGVVRDMLKIPGEYRGKKGVFEFIKESDGAINHRLFKPTSAE